MWEVVGFRFRVTKNGEYRYVDLYLQREATAPAKGIEVKAVDYREDKIAYVPQIGDRVVPSMGSYQGRQFLSDLVVC